jgi:protein-S-isoprenylcysteine O-methyltransferase Ste14
VEKMDYLVLVVGWLVYFGLHSGLAAHRVKRLFHPRWFRLLYSFIATAGLLALLFWNGKIQSQAILKSDGWLRYLSLMLTTFGVMLIQLSFKQYSLRAFLGLANEPKEFKTEGILAHVRHPIYAGTILIIIGFFFFIPNWPTLVSCLLMLGYLPVGIYFEEKKLVAAFGDQYLAYKKRVPSLIPRF